MNLLNRKVSPKPISQQISFASHTQSGCPLLFSASSTQMRSQCKLQHHLILWQKNLRLDLDMANARSLKTVFRHFPVYTRTPFPFLWKTTQEVCQIFGVCQIFFCDTLLLQHYYSNQNTYIEILWKSTLWQIRCCWLCAVSFSNNHKISLIHKQFHSWS